MSDLRPSIEPEPISYRSPHQGEQLGLWQLTSFVLGVVAISFSLALMASVFAGRFVGIVATWSNPIRKGARLGVILSTFALILLATTVIGVLALFSR